MRQIIIDFGFLIDNWEIENKNPSKKLLEILMNTFFSGNYGSNFSFLLPG